MGAVPRSLATFWRKAYGDGLTGLAAMIAYNLLLSVFPLAFLALAIAGSVLGSPELERSVLADLRQLFPRVEERSLSELINSIRRSSTSFGVVAAVAALWVSGSFWGALDTAFCRIYRLPCRSWVQQKLFSLAMLVVVLLFAAATVVVPAGQALIAASAEDLPFGLGDVQGPVYVLTLVAGVIVLFLMLCAIYRWVPNCPMPWTCIWPGALGATLVITAVDYVFPLYLSQISTIAQLGSSLVFVLIALLWFYALALVVLAGAVVNDLRLERLRAAPTSG